jgi:hypothetical protein
VPAARSWRSSFFNYFYFTINIGTRPCATWRVLRSACGRAVHVQHVLGCV